MAKCIRVFAIFQFLTFFAVLFIRSQVQEMGGIVVGVALVNYMSKGGGIVSRRRALFGRFLH